MKFSADVSTYLVFIRVLRNGGGNLELNWTKKEEFCDETPEKSRPISVIDIVSSQYDKK